MDDNAVVQAVEILKLFIKANSLAPTEEVAILELTQSKGRISMLTENVALRSAFYDLMVEVRAKHSAHKAVVHDMRRDHGDALVAHRQEIAGNARYTFHRFAPILRKFLRGEIELAQARTDILDAIDPSLRDGEMMRDLEGLVDEGHALLLRLESFRDKAARLDVVKTAIKDL
jgi:hypothetical protein